MNKTSSAIANAFALRKACKVSNTQTNGNTVTLHGNCIAYRLPSEEVRFCLCGWNTRTTHARINAIADALELRWRVFTRQGVPHRRCLDTGHEEQIPRASSFQLSSLV